MDANNSLDANSVWNTLGNLAGKVIDYKTQALTRAAPTGAPQKSGANPWFGNWGAYPQAEAKTQPGATQFTIQQFMPFAIVAAVLFVLFALVRR